MGAQGLEPWTRRLRGSLYSSKTHYLSRKHLNSSQWKLNRFQPDRKTTIRPPLEKKPRPSCAFSKHYPPENYVIGALSDSLKLMAGWVLRWLSAVRTRLRQRLDLLLEFIVLRRQLAVLQRTGTRRPRFRPSERLFWVFRSRPTAIARPRAVYNSYNGVVLYVCREQPAQKANDPQCPSPTRRPSAGQLSWTRNHSKPKRQIRATSSPFLSKTIYFQKLAETETAELTYLIRCIYCIFTVTNSMIPPLIPP